MHSRAGSTTALICESARRVAVIRDGQLITFAPPKDLKEQFNVATLEEVYEHLVHPNAADSIAAYFEESV